MCFFFFFFFSVCDLNYTQVCGCVCLMGVRAFICLSLFICLFIYLFREYLVRGTPTAGVLLHWVVISRRWERIQARDSELPINTDSPRKKSATIQWLNREITGPQNTQN